MNNNNFNSVKEKGWKYLLLSFATLLAICLEFVHSYIWEPFVFGDELTKWENSLHVLITALSWGVAAYLIARIAKNKLDFDVLTKGSKMKLWQVSAVLLGIAISVSAVYLQYGKFRLVLEYNQDVTYMVFQYFYYMVEALMILLIVIFAQKAFDIWTKKPNVPWGGIICAVTFGILHFVSSGAVDIPRGIFATIAGFFFGASYLFTNRDFKKSWLILFLMFAF